MATAARPELRRPTPVGVLVVLAPILTELALLALPSLGAHGWYWEAVASQSSFALAPLAVLICGGGWGSIGLSRSNLTPSLALGVTLSLLVVLPQLVLVLMGVLEPGSLVDEPSLFLGLPLALVFYLFFWGVFEGVWMCYSLFAFDRWLYGGGALRWRSLFLRPFGSP